MTTNKPGGIRVYIFSRTKLLRIKMWLTSLAKQNFEEEKIRVTSLAKHNFEEDKIRVTSSAEQNFEEEKSSIL